jgi:hypothetical protein
VVDLTTEPILELKERFGSLHDAAVAALQDSPFAEELEATGARLTKVFRSDRITFTPPREQYESLFWKLVWATHAPASARRRPSYRPPDQLATKTVCECERELAKRAGAGSPKTGPLTLEAIANRIGWPRPRVRQAEQLRGIGWPLLRTHPDFSTDEGFRALADPREGRSTPTFALSLREKPSV